MGELVTAADIWLTTDSIGIRRESKLETDFDPYHVTVCECFLKIARCTIHADPMVTVWRMRMANGLVLASFGGAEHCAMNVSEWMDAITCSPRLLDQLARIWRTSHRRYSFC